MSFHQPLGHTPTQISNTLPLMQPYPPPHCHPNLIPQPSQIPPTFSLAATTAVRTHLLIIADNPEAQETKSTPVFYVARTTKTISHSHPRLHPGPTFHASPAPTVAHSPSTALSSEPPQNVLPLLFNTTTCVLLRCCRSWRAFVNGP